MARYRITYQVDRVGFGDTKEQAIKDSKCYEENPYSNPLDSAEVIAIEEEEQEREVMERSHSWLDMANLTHETQVIEFKFCLCEEQEQFPYEDCPKER